MHKTTKKEKTVLWHHVELIIHLECEQDKEYNDLRKDRNDVINISVLKEEVQADHKQGV